MGYLKKKVYRLKLEEKTDADCKGKQNGGETAFGTGCLKIQIDGSVYKTFNLSVVNDKDKESIVNGSIQIETVKYFVA